MGRVSRAVQSAIGALVVVVATLVVLPAAPAAAHTPHDTIIDLAVSPTFATDRTLFVISRERLLKSTNGGASWTTLVRGLDANGQLSGLSMVRDQPSTLYVSTRGGGVYRSDDGGMTWAARTSGMEDHRNLAWVEAAPGSADIVLASEAWGGGLYRSADGGATWAPTGFAAVTAAAFAPDDPRFVVIGDARGTVRTSSDGGATWSEPVQLVAPKYAVRALTVGPARAGGGGRDVYAGSDTKGLRRSTDSGRTFEPVDLPHRVRSVLLSPTYASDQRWWASTWGSGVCRSAGGADPTCASDGLTENEQADWLSEPQFGRVVTPAEGDGSPLFVGAFTGLFQSNDGGETWREIQTQRSTEVVAISVARSPSGPATVVVTNYLNGVFRATAASPTWTQIDKGLATGPQWTGAPTYVARLIGVVASPAYEQDQTLFASNRGFLLRSTDAGLTWEQVTPKGMINRADQPPDYFWITPSPAFARDGVIILGTNRGKIFRSDDRGSTWTRMRGLGDPVTTMAISPAFERDATVFATTADDVFRSTDGGRTWKALPGAPAGVVSLSTSPAYASDRRVFAGTAEGLLVSDDGGTSWAPVTVGDAPPTAYVEAVVPSPALADDGVVLVSLKGRGLFRSTDGGRTFGPIAPELLADQIVFNNWYHSTTEPIAFSPDFARDRTIYAYADTELYRSTDGGDTWTVVERPVVRHSTSAAAAPAPLLQTPTFPRDGSGHEHGGDGTDEAAAPVAAATPATGTGPFTAPRVGGAVLVIVLVGAGIVIFRRRAGSSQGESGVA